ncbi:hypothetical protein CAOG_00875 [Capsaspora owczarzaki ATCC 30864]|uniref:PCI domain-containing protein n=1 Tax=Capsaspora owczarzaki (strain ATCC 30864) TaxID=595528 RepID=A0A0D2VHF9_CAPO3|nr:hypothetical protein CAOG_00875 [Capsaspora owczarzaki ATCC 30864]KJE89397.1 hypothetical protein CAOG_000875 [Capsaspora owczarzaki ATCC 30864]|eukprot:XP_004365746.2 hypothetical protein CAOG_00875 [Capsaspora owczarzaki ATCC 30864]
MASSVAALEPFLILARTAKGAACASLINQAIEAQGTFVFSELLATPAVKELEGTAHQQSLELLKLFAYGSYADYTANPSRFPPLSATQQTKLRLLSIVSLASDCKTIPYAKLLAVLALDNVRELEDIIIEGIYSNVLKASLNQQHQHVRIEFAIGRDIASNAQLDSMIQTLGAWCQQCETLLTNIHSNIASANRQKTSAMDEQVALQERIAIQKQAFTSQMSHKLMDGHGLRDFRSGYGTDKKGRRKF